MNNAMIQKLKKMQQELKEGQERIERTEFEASATGVKVVVLGNKSVLQILISEEIMVDRETVQDSVLIALNSAFTKVDNALKALYSQYNIPGLGGF